MKLHKNTGAVLKNPPRQNLSVTFGENGPVPAHLASRSGIYVDSAHGPWAGRARGNLLLVRIFQFQCAMGNVAGIPRQIPTYKNIISSTMTWEIVMHIWTTRYLCSDQKYLSNATCQLHITVHLAVSPNITILPSSILQTT